MHTITALAHVQEVCLFSWSEFLHYFLLGFVIKRFW